MYGLANAVKVKGLNAVGMKLSIDDLKPNNIVFITVNGGPHYSVVREVTNESVKLADPSLGNIEMSREKFDEVYSGNALVISDSNNSTQVNGTTNQTNNQENQNVDGTNPSVPANNTDANPANVQSENRTLTKEEMQNIRGKHQGGWIYVWVYGKYWTWCHWHYGRFFSYFGYQKYGYTVSWRTGWHIDYWWGPERGWHKVRVYCIGTPPWNWDRKFTPSNPYNSPY